MRPTIFLHIGRGQCGSTAVQRALTQYRRVLRQHGVHYLRASDARSGGHQVLARSLISDLPPHMPRVRNPAQVQGRVLAEIQKCRTPVVLMSSENFTLADPEVVRRFFDGFDVRIILFVRSQDELAESLYNLVVKRLCETRSFAEFVNGALEDFDFEELADRWAAPFGRDNVICRVYDGQRRSGLRDLLSCLSIDALENFEESPERGAWSASNSSLGIRALHIVRLLNSLEISQRPRLYRRLVGPIAASDLPAVLLGSEEAAALRQRFTGSNTRFSERYLGKAQPEVGGRRYSDADRDRIREQITELSLSFE